MWELQFVQPLGCSMGTKQTPTHPMTSKYCHFDAVNDRSVSDFFETLRLVPHFLFDNYEKIRSVQISILHLNGKRTRSKQVKTPAFRVGREKHYAVRWRAMKNMAH